MIKKIKIDYLTPVLVTHEDKEYICFVDYAKNNIYCLSEMDEDTKNNIHDLILKEVNEAALRDITMPDVINDFRITQVISDIKNDVLRKEFDKSIIEDKTNE